MAKATLKDTFTAGFGVAGQNRLKGNAHNNNIWRVIIGIEYYLADPRLSEEASISLSHRL